jgi:hypothetical protein
MSRHRVAVKNDNFIEMRYAALLQGAVSPTVPCTTQFGGTCRGDRHYKTGHVTEHRQGGYPHQQTRGYVHGQLGSGAPMPDGEESRPGPVVHNVGAGSCASSNALTAARADTATSARRSMRAANPAPS